ncbi:NB-ARC domain-containing protein [Streptomyces sp. A1547]|uniref:NB-ARC domain-containing protein n=1 Tax=Streptomyces sp. A1547 TaxID=2563105 RepID=UPI001F0D39EB|nr:NB-ARC domain-containing protein [Streptomyces sp. A1547]
MGAAAAAWLLVVTVRDGWGGADPVASVFGAVAGLAALASSLAVQSGRAQQARALPPRAPALEDWVLPRSELEAAVAAVCRQDHGSAVALTTALKGAGGFGKTTLARLVSNHPHVLRHFGAHVYFVTIGRDVRGRAAVAAKVAAVTHAVTGDSLAVSQDSDPLQMGEHLGDLLSRRPRTLLVLDDVWTAEQLAPFLRGAAKRCVRLVTTRNPDALPQHAVRITVDRMSPAQARGVLCHGLGDSLSASVVDELVRATGCWPLLLRMVNQFILTLTATGITGTEAAEQIRLRLQTWGPTGADGGAPLDLDDPQRRNEAVRASIQAATTLLPADSDARFTELGIFAEDEHVPLRLVTLLWRATAGLDEAKARHLCKQMADLSLLAIDTATDGGAVVLHDVIRDYLRIELGDRLAAVNAAFLDALAADVPVCAATGANPAPDREWWQTGDAYLLDHLIGHFIEAGRREEAEHVAGDLRWVRRRLRQRGPTAPALDLETIGTPTARTLAADLIRAAHLLAPTDLRHCWDAVLRSRLHALPHWGEQALALPLAPPVLIDRWPPPDLPHPALRRTLTGHTMPVTSVAVSPDGTWLATASSDETLRIWDASTGHERLVVSLTATVTSVAISPDGTWFATAGTDGTARIRDAITGHERLACTGHTGSLASVAISPDGTWFATAGHDHTARIWDAVTGHERLVCTGHTGSLASVAISPDGTWFATAGYDHTARIWDAATGHERSVLEGHSDAVMEVAISPGGAWLATAGYNSSIHLWDAAAGRRLHALVTHHDSVWSVAASPDASWLVACHGSGAVHLWDTATRADPIALTGHRDLVLEAAFGPDGAWIATASHDNTVRIWDVVDVSARYIAAGHTERVWSAAISSDRTWLATASSDDTARIWNTATGQEIHTLVGHTGSVWSVDVSRDGTWLATAGSDDTARIWNTATGQEIHTLVGHTDSVWSVAVSPDGTWLATSSEDGTTRIWDAGTGACLHTLDDVDSVGRVAIDPRGAWLATASSDTVTLWDAATGRKRHTLAGHARLVVQVEISPDGRWLATASHDQTVRMWDAATGREIHTLAGHRKSVSSVAISPDGTWLATAGDDHTARIWDAATGRELHTLTGHTNRVSSVAISPDGTWLATTSDDNTVRVWNVRTGSPTAMTRTDGGLRTASWGATPHALFIGGEAGLYGYEFRPGEGPREG